MNPERRSCCPESGAYQVPYTEVRTYDFQCMADAMLNNTLVTIECIEGRIQSLSRMDDGRIKVFFYCGLARIVNAR